MSSLFEFLSRLLDFITGIFSSKKEDKTNLWSEILDCRAQLSAALSEGRITDVHALRLRLDSLMKKYSRHIRKEESSMSKSSRSRRTPSAYAVSMFFALFAVSLFMSACSTTGKKQKQEVLVIGERINVVQPGSAIQVPNLVPPASKWYLVDDVAILQWLGIPVDYGRPGHGGRRDITVTDVRDGSMSVSTYSYDFETGRWVEVVPR